MRIGKLFDSIFVLTNCCLKLLVEPSHLGGVRCGCFLAQSISLGKLLLGLLERGFSDGEQLVVFVAQALQRFSMRCLERFERFLVMTLFLTEHKSMGFLLALFFLLDLALKVLTGSLVRRHGSGQSGARSGHLLCQGT